MTRYAFEAQGGKQFEWPEPLVIDVINESYTTNLIDLCDRLTIARLHARALCALYLGESQRSAAFRLELIAFCAARDIQPETIAGIDSAVYSELVNLVSVTYRTSPRMVTLVVEHLDATLGPLYVEPVEPAEPVEPRPVYPPVVRRPALAARAAVA